MVTRHFQRYSSEARATHAASHRTGFRKRQSIGEVFYMTDRLPNCAFPTRKAALQAEQR